jgi:DNA polymerase III subunit epsilon
VESESAPSSGTDLDMRRVLLLDTETQGLSPEKHMVIEVAVMLYDLERACALQSYASLIRATGGNEAQRVNKIPADLLPVAPEARDVWTAVEDMRKLADCVAAHNAEFDRKFVEAAGAKVSGPWCCTKTDFEWPNDLRGDSLVQLALGLGLGVAIAHRAMADVDTMARVLTRVHELGHSLPALFRRAARPKKRFVAMVSYESKDLAKQHGFLWSAEKREWWRMMPPDDAEALSFRVVQRD